MDGKYPRTIRARTWPGTLWKVGREREREVGRLFRFEEEETEEESGGGGEGGTKGERGGV